MRDRAHPATRAIRMGRIAACLAGCVGVFLLGRPLPAVAQITWIGDTSTSFTNGANWEGGIAPTAADQAVFGSAFGAYQPSLTSGTVASLRFLSPTGGWTVTASSTLTLNTLLGIDDSANTSGTTTINGSLFLAATGTKNLSVGVGGTILVNGILNISSSVRVVNVSGGVVSVNGLRGGGSTGAAKSGDGTLIVNGPATSINSPTGFSLHGGTLVLGDRLAVGAAGMGAAAGTTIQASTDLTGTNYVPNRLGIPTGAGVTISGTQSIEFLSIAMSNQNSDASLTNDITAGKTLTLRSVEGNSSTPSPGVLRTLLFRGSGHTIITGSMIDGTGGRPLRYTKAGSGMLTLQGEGLFTGGMTVQEGTLKIEHNQALGATAAPLVVSGGLLDLGGLTVTKSGTITLSGGTIANGTISNDTVNYAVSLGTVSANLAGTVGLTKTSGSTVILSGTNTYGGATTISAGMLQFGTRSALYGGTSALWTAANLNTSGTLAIDVGGAGEFDATDVTTLLTNLGGTGGAVNNDGLRAGSRIGFDTSNAAGSTFTIADSIANSTGVGGGAIGLVKLGSGTLVLSGSNSYTGGTVVNGGMLRLGDANAIGTGGITVNGGAVDLNSYSGSSAAVSLGGVATQTGFTGGGTLTLGGTVNYAASPAGAVIEPTLVLGGSSRTFAVGGSGVGSDALTVSGLISSTSGLIKTGTGRLVLSSSASTYSGKTTIQSGVLEVSSLSGTGVAGSLGAPTTAANARIDLGTGTTFATLRYTGTGGHSTNRPIFLAGSAGGGGILDASGSGPVSFTGGVTGVAGTTLTLTGSNTGGNYITAVTGSNVFKTGVGTWVFGTNSFTGQLFVQQGTIVASVNAPGGTGTSSALGQENGPIPVVGLADATGTAALLAANGVTISRVIEVAALGSGDQEVVLGGSGAGTATFDGNSAFRLGRGVTLAADPGGNVRFLTPTANWDQQDGSADPAVAVTIGTPTATGTVTLETTLPNSLTAVTVRQGTLRLGNGTTVGALGPTSVLTGSAGATLAFDRSDTISSGVHFASAIGGAMNVRQQGSGTVVLAGVNTYTGATDVIAGTLEVDGVLGNTAVTVAAGATLSGTGTIGGPTTILGTHAPGSSPGIETFTNGLTYGATSTLVWELIANTESPGSRGVLFDGVDLTGGALSIVNGATLSLVFDLPGSTVDWDNAFWGTNRAWTIIDVAGGSWNSSLFTLQVGVDSTSATLASKRPDSLFQIVDLGGDLVLEYVIVPEPGALALAGFGLAAAWGYHRRRRARTRVR
jgi:fibronectin-binding autotransporter adhesin